MKHWPDLQKAPIAMEKRNIGCSTEAIYFQSKEKVMYTLGKQMFFQNNPFEAIKTRNDLNGLHKIRTLLARNQSNTEQSQLNMQASPILKDPHILAAAIRENKRILTPL